MGSKLLIVVFLLATVLIFFATRVRAVDKWWGCSFSTPLAVSAGTSYVVSLDHSAALNNFTVGSSFVTPQYWVRPDGSPWDGPFVFNGPKIRFFAGATEQEGINADKTVNPGETVQGVNSEYGAEWKPQGSFSLTRMEFFSSDPGAGKIRVWDETPGPDNILPNNILAECTVETNQPAVTLTPNAGGPYLGTEGTPVSLDASGSTVSSGSIVSYKWDLTNSGSFNDASVAQTQYTWHDEFNGPVKVQITDGLGNIATASASINIANVAPTAQAGADVTVFSGQAVAFAGTYNDPSSLDTFTFNWDFGDGNSTPGTLNITHTYFPPGTYTAILTVTDDDGGVGQSQRLVKVNPIVASVDFHPGTLNLKSKGKKVTVFIALPAGFDINNIDVGSIRLNGVVPVKAKPVDQRCHDDEDQNDDSDNKECKKDSDQRQWLKVKFDRQLVIPTLSPGSSVEVKVTGNLVNGVAFAGSDFIKVKAK